MSPAVSVAQSAIAEEQAFLYATVGASVPIALWLAFFYTRDRYDREPKRLIALLFVVGAVPAAIVAGLVNGLVLSGAVPLLGPALGLAAVAVLVAPVVEETLKYGGASIARFHRAFDEPVDGMVYGTTVGLGFAFSENVDYLLMGYAGVPVSGDLLLCEPGLECLVTLAMTRGFGSALLHGLATGLAGYFLSQRVLGGRPRSVEGRGLRLAVAGHGAWNLGAVASPVLTFVVLAALAVVYSTLLRRALAASPHRVSQVDDRRHVVGRFAVGGGPLQRCPACGYLHSATAEHCPVCADRLLARAAHPAEPCPRCGEPQPASARFCGACGQPLAGRGGPV